MYYYEHSYRIERMDIAPSLSSAIRGDEQPLVLLAMAINLLILNTCSNAPRTVESDAWNSYGHAFTLKEINQLLTTDAPSIRRDLWQKMGEASTCDNYVLASAYCDEVIENLSSLFLSGRGVLSCFPNHYIFAKDSGVDYFPLISFENYRQSICGLENEIHILCNNVSANYYLQSGEREKTYYHLLNECKSNYDEKRQRYYERIIQGKKDELAREIWQSLQAIGFPYSPTISDYIRYNETNETKYRELKNGVKDSIIQRPKYMEFKFSDLKKLFYPSPLSGRIFENGHTYIVGRGGSGKSELLKTIIFQCLYDKTHRIVIDPHGELADDIALINSKKKVVDFSKNRFTINLFDTKDKSSENRELVAQEITDLLGELMEDSSLSRLMKTVAFPIIYTLLRLPYADFSMLRDVIHPTDGVEKLKALENLVEPHHRAIWGDLMGDAYDTTKRSVFNRLQSLLNYSGLYNNLCGKDDFKTVIRQKLNKREDGTVFVVFSLPSTRIGSEVSQTLGRVLMTRLQIWAKRRGVLPPDEREKMVLFVDEFQNFLSQATAQTLDQFGRKFGLNLVMAHQHTAQLTDREIKASVLANSKNKIVGMSNKDTRQALAGEMGLKAEDFEDLSQGFFMVKVDTKAPKKLYFRKVYNSSGDGTEFVTSHNQGVPEDVWGYTMNQPRHDTSNPKGTRQSASEEASKKTYKPKFDL